MKNKKPVANKSKRRPALSPVTLLGHDQRQRFDALLKQKGVTLLPWQKEVADKLLDKPHGSGKTTLLALLAMSEIKIFFDGAMRNMRKWPNEKGQAQRPEARPGHERNEQ